MEKYYTLKIYDISLVDFSVQADEFGRLDVTVHEINDNKKHLFPFQMLTDVSGKNLSSWLKGRTIPKNRRYVTQLLSLVGLTLNDTMGIIDMCKGLSVNDAYWLDDHTDFANAGMEPYSEYFAAQVAKQMGIFHILCKIQTVCSFLQQVLYLFRMKVVLLWERCSMSNYGR